MAETQLYGGAMCAVLPPGSKDMSKLRQIPDNQEVFTHSQTDQSVIIEILEYVNEDDQTAIKTHFDDIGDGNGTSEDDRAILQTEAIPLDRINMQQCDCAWYILGQQHISKFKEVAKNTVHIHMGLFRLQEFTTDIVVTFNDPINIDPASSSSKSVPVNTDRWLAEDFKQLLSSLRILDVGLFGSE